MVLPKMHGAYGLALVVHVILAGLLWGPVTGQSGLDGQAQTCFEPDNLIELYRELRERQIAEAGLLHDPNPASAPRSSTATITGLTPYRRQPGSHSGLCRCESRDELNHDPTRIPRILPQSSCTRSICRGFSCSRRWDWRTNCEEIYRTERVKKRAGCVNGVYQYVDAWESVPIGCRCHVYPRVLASRD